MAPVSDTYVNESAPNTNYGGSWSLASRGGSDTVSYLRFRLPAAPTGKTLTGATLRIRTADQTFAGSSASHHVRLASNAWTNPDTTWVNRPAVGTTLLGTFSAAGPAPANG